MIRVESITISEFRGIRDLSLDLKGENFAVCGPNGTGKSGVVDALEFGLTGNISRLSGKATGAVSLKEHAPHVDSRNRPDKARVVLHISIPSLRKKVVIDRTVKDANSPSITPADPDVLEILAQVALHPEFVLSRRELIRYVISTPGDRAKEVQALLRIDQVEELRGVLQKIANACERAVEPIKRERTQAHEQLVRALEIPQLSEAKLLDAVNERRALLGLVPIKTLNGTTSLKDGLSSASTVPPAHIIPKVQAIADVQTLAKTFDKITAAETTASLTVLMQQLTELNNDPAIVSGITREDFLRSALDHIDEDKCPVCDTPWRPDDLRELVGRKLKRFEETSKKRSAAEEKLVPLTALVFQLHDGLARVEQYGKMFVPSADTKSISGMRLEAASRRKQFDTFLPLSQTIAELQNLSTIPADLLTEVSAIETRLAAIPEPTKQDAARDYLTLCQERLEVHRGAWLRLKRAEEEATLTRGVYDKYAQVSTSVLDDIYKQVQKDFRDLYRFINRDDEGSFEAQLTPSIGKLSFDVDFYGRGFFPPGAYHSEGHQDSMGLCLYLALMRHLLGAGFTFAVLDDVLMSVDAGHRREVCNLLKEKFRDTQFILTTHDPIWLRHMKTAGLVGPDASIQFRKWEVGVGPSEWDERDVWRQIEDNLQANDVREAAALLRYYLEYVSAEICHCLRAPVEFRGDAQFQLGDLLPKATKQFSELLNEGEMAARSWGKASEASVIAAQRAEFRQAVKESNVEQWQINPAVHYNGWANLDKADFTPVVVAHRRLIESFFCANCRAPFRVVPERGPRENLRCTCAPGINLVRH